MKLNVFDVVKLKDGNKATIVEIIKNNYKVEVVNEFGISQGIKKIEKNDITNVIFSRYIEK